MKTFCRIFTLLCLALSLGVARAQEPTDVASQIVVPIDLPQHGTLVPISGEGGAAYLTFSDKVDSFRFAAADDGGVTLFDVTVDPLLGVATIDTIDGGGPTVRSVKVVSIGLVADDTNARNTLGDKKDGKKGGTDGESESGSSGDTGSGDSSGDANSDDESDLPWHPTERRNGYWIIIHVDRPGDGDGDGKQLIENRDVGHAFIEIIDGPNGRSLIIGLYPHDGIPSKDPLAPVPGEIVDDSGHESDVDYEVPVGADLFHKLIDQVEQDCANPPNYDLNDNNCVDYVVRLADIVGLQVDPPDHWLFPGDTPGKFADYLEKRD